MKELFGELVAAFAVLDELCHDVQAFARHITDGLGAVLCDCRRAEFLLPGTFSFCRARLLFLTLLIFSVYNLPSFGQSPDGQQKILAGYYEEWGTSSNYSVADLEKNGVAAELTHLIYAFGNVVTTPSIGCAIADPKAAYLNTGLPSVSGAPYTAPPYGNFGALIQLKRLHPKLKVLISLGGAAAGNVAFSIAASTRSGRQALVASCIDIFIKGNVGKDSTGNPISIGSLFDGVNVDWEYPTSTDKHNYTLLLQEFRRQLNILERTNHKNYILTIDSPTRPNDYFDLEFAEVAKQVDFLTLDGYDFSSSSDKTTNHASALYASKLDPVFGRGMCIDSAVTAYLRAGVPGGSW